MRSSAFQCFYLTHAPPRQLSTGKSLPDSKKWGRSVAHLGPDSIYFKIGRESWARITQHLLTSRLVLFPTFMSKTVQGSS